MVINIRLRTADSAALKPVRSQTPPFWLIRSLKKVWNDDIQFTIIFWYLLCQKLFSTSMIYKDFWSLKKLSSILLYLTERDWLANCFRLSIANNVGEEASSRSRLISRLRPDTSRLEQRNPNFLIWWSRIDQILHPMNFSLKVSQPNIGRPKKERKKSGHSFSFRYPAPWLWNPERWATLYCYTA